MPYDASSDPLCNEPGYHIIKITAAAEVNDRTCLLTVLIGALDNGRSWLKFGPEIGDYKNLDQRHKEKADETAQLKADADKERADEDKQKSDEATAWQRDQAAKQAEIDEAAADRAHAKFAPAAIKLFCANWKDISANLSDASTAKVSVFPFGGDSAHEAKDYGFTLRFFTNAQSSSATPGTSPSQSVPNGGGSDEQGLFGSLSKVGGGSLFGLAATPRQARHLPPSDPNQTLESDGSLNGRVAEMSMDTDNATLIVNSLNKFLEWTDVAKGRHTTNFSKGITGPSRIFVGGPDAKQDQDPQRWGLRDDISFRFEVDAQGATWLDWRIAIGYGVNIRQSEGEARGTAKLLGSALDQGKALYDHCMARAQRGEGQPEGDAFK